MTVDIVSLQQENKRLLDAIKNITRREPMTAAGWTTTSYMPLLGPESNHDWRSITG